MSTLASEMRSIEPPTELKSPSGVRLKPYIALTKPRITFMISLSAAAGFIIASSSPIQIGSLLHLIVGIALLTSGTSALNQYWERELDALMPRTKSRPLPAKEVSPVAALWFGVIISIAAIVYLQLYLNFLTALLGFSAFASYLFMYTPLKTRSTWCTFVGAFPGALPPLIGWVAARNAINIEGIVLFAILFLWQFPHFHAIASLYREDYSRAGIKMLPVVEPDGRATAREILGYSVALLLVSLLPTYLKMAGIVYLVGAFALGVYLLNASLVAAKALNREHSLRLLKASVFYLPLLWGLMIWKK